MKAKFAVATCLVITLAALTVVAFHWIDGKNAHETNPETYADPNSCAQCHATEAAAYATTGMAHSFYKPQAKDTIQAPAKEHQFFHATSATYYSMTEHDGRYFQRRWQRGFDGRPDNIEELQIDYVMGSGNHVRTYLHREEDGTLIELPLAWYAESGGHWGMNPGYDNPRPRTRRLIAYECMFCHNAYPEIPETAHRDLSASPVYKGALPEGIDCQRCHGPGASHVHAAQTPGTPLSRIRSLILNPAHLSNSRKMEVCEQCHLETTSRSLPDRIRHYDQQPFGYMANQSLSSFNSYFAQDAEKSRTDNFEIVNAPYRLRQSHCYLKSKGALTCETCHNPHDLHKGPKSASYYASICMKCHAENLTTPIALHQHPDSNDCVSCHMPKRRTEDVVHAVMTDHLIQRNPPSAKELLAERQELPETDANAYRGEVKRYLLDNEGPSLTDSIYNALAQVIDSSNLEIGIPQLEKALRVQSSKQPNFFMELGDGMRHAGNLSGAINAYRQALELDPLSSRAQRRLGVTLGSNGQEDEALSVLQEAIDHEPGNALLWYERALIESRAGKHENAIADLKKSLQLKPDFSDALNNLGSNLAQKSDLQGAEAAFRAALTIEPYNAGARANLGRLLAEKTDWRQAAFQLQKAVQLDGTDANAHLAYAVVLIQMNHLHEAKNEANAAMNADPKSSQARDLMAQILAQRSR